MRFGICTTFDKIGLLEKLGYDYLEASIQSIAFLSDGEFEQVKEKIDASRLKVEAFNVLLPGDLKVVGPEADEGRLVDYLCGAFARAKALGAEIVVFGSGGARKRPENFPEEEAMQQLYRVARIMAECAAPFGITVVSEPLNRGETNTVNSLAAGYVLAEAAAHPNFQLLADIYHMALENEGPEEITKYGDRLRHVHIANPKGRVYPLEEGEFDYRSYLKALQAAGYDARISVEAGTEDMETDGAKALALLQSLWG